MLGFVLAPYLHSPEDITFLLYILARVSGMLLIAPLISNSLMGRVPKLGLTFFLTIIMAMVLYPHYRGEAPQFALPELTEGQTTSLAMLGITLGKELGIGWLLGLTFTLIFEALLLAGQQVGMMVGFSVSEILDPVSGTSQPLIANFFTISASLLIIIQDLHHVLLRVLTDSFMVIPLGNYHLPYQMLQDVTNGTAMLFAVAMRFAAIAFVILYLVTIGLGFIARVMPEMNIFMVGFPLRILVGYYVLIVTIHYFPRILSEAFVAFHHLAERLSAHIGLGSSAIT